MQTCLFAAPAPTWEYHLGMPERSGTAKYVHLIMWTGDPPETMGRGKGKQELDENICSEGRSSTHWKRTHSAEVYKEKIMSLMSDGEPRTFNRICVEITGTNGNVWFEKEPDIALWSLVEEGRLAWACELKATFFIDSTFVEWP